MLSVHQRGHNNTVAKSGDRSLGRMAQMGGRAITKNHTGTISTRERGSYVRGLHINILTLPALVLKFYLRVVHRCASCIMGMFKWLKKDIVLRDRNRRNLPLENSGLNNEAYRNALQAFIDRRRIPNEPGGITLSSPEKARLEIFIKNKNNTNNEKKDDNSTIPGVPHIPAPEVFEIGWVAGTEDRYLELIFAEWQNTRVSLKRHTHPQCQNAIKADLEVLTEIRHPNILLLMATTQTDDHGLVAIFEPVDCTLYNYIHEQGERISVQSAAKCSGKLADALRHAHMRGYIHGALSSHCVYLASGGNVKLGGWELSVTEDKPSPDREYESRLRAEIFRWQAPEIFRGQTPSKASDVYGLALLIWEMCTMRVPWNGFSEPDVERQFVHWDRAVMTDLYNFPPLLNNLLEAGLQLDVTKRTLDMNRMRRFLQRLELQYETEEAMYIDHYANNNNNQQVKGQNKPVSAWSHTNSPSSAKNTGAETPKTSRTKKQRDPERIMSNWLRESPSKKELHPGRVNLFLDVKNARSTEQSHKIMNMFAEVQKNNNEVNAPKGNLNVVSDLQRNNDNEDVRRWSFAERIEDDGKNDYETYSNVGCNSSSSVASTSTGATNSVEENPQSALKKLKESLANKRENFFYGNNASQISIPETISPQMRIKILEDAKNKDCEPHKPASHKTSFELKMNKSPTTMESFLTKQASHKNQKSPYSSIPRVIKESIFQPQTLNTDSQSFFESSLWRKEKLICLSKMSPSPPDGNGSRNPTGMDNNERKNRLEPPKNIEGYTINNNSTRTEQKIDETQIVNGNSTLPYDDFINKASLENYNSKDESIRTLKDALNRATNIVASETSNIEDTSRFSPTRTLSASEITLEDIKAREAVFEDMYRLAFDNTNSDIRSIERETDGNGTFVSITRPSSFEDGSSGSFKNENGNHNFLSDKEKAQCLSYESNFVCESIAETSLEDDSSARNEKRPNVDPGESDNTITMETSVPQMVKDKDNGTESSGNETSVHESNYTFLFITDKTRENACQSCNNKSALTRRRSLPAGLGQLKTMNSNSSLGKLPIRKVDVPHNPSDDIYFDDDFGEKLSVNMVLMDDEVRRDDDFLPDILDLSNSSVYT